MKPFYFGSQEKPLFGCYHAPQAGPTRVCGVVFCHSMGDEYIRFHRAYRQLAIHLSNVGFPVLRFDFYGCGDSSGGCEQGQLRQWLTDISTAIDEIRRRCGLTKVCLVGLRLGGSLAMLAGAARGDIDGTVLWDPVVSGGAYLQELVALHQDMLRVAHVKLEPRTTDGEHTEILGFPLTDYMLTDLENLDLLSTYQKSVNNILVIQSNEKADQGRFLEYLKSIGVHAEYQRLPSPQFWIWMEDFARVLVPQQILQSIVSWISERYP